MFYLDHLRVLLSSSAYQAGNGLSFDQLSSSFVTDLWLANQPLLCFSPKGEN